MKKNVLLTTGFSLFAFYLCFFCSAVSSKAAPSGVDYNVLHFGAKGDGKTLDTKPIQDAIEKAAEDGGGTVFFPAGTYLSGTLFLKNNITLHLEAGSILEGSKHLGDYPVTHSQIRSYTDNYTNKSLIYAEGKENISITGRGTIDGNGAAFKVDHLRNDEGVRKKDDFAFYKTRPFLIRMINCKNIHIRDVTMLNSPMWVQHYLLCEDVYIDGITVESRVNHNNDGIDIDGCSRVRISNCNISSGDDAIVIKSTLGTPCQNITVTNCVLSSACNAFKLGTESNGGFQNITFSNSTIYDTRLAGIALEMVDGGSLNNVSVSGINMDDVGCAVFVRLGNRARRYKENMSKPGMGSLFNVIISNIQGTNIGKTGCSITGLPSYPVGNLTLNNIRLHFEGGGTADLITREIEELPEKYPEHNMFGTLPAFGFFFRHVSGISLENLNLSCELPESRPALYLQHVEGARISALKASGETAAPAMIFIDRSQEIVVKECDAHNRFGSLAMLKNGSKDIGFIHCNLWSKNNIYKSDKTVKNQDITTK